MIALNRALAFNIFLMPLALLPAILATTANAATVGDQSGVSIAGVSAYLYQPCTTFACEPAFGIWSNDSQGGPGRNLVNGGGAGGFDNSNSEFSSSALLVGTTAVPLLKAYAKAFTEPGTYPGYSSDCCYLNSAVADAQGAQYYTYIGTEPMNYEIFYSLHGSASGKNSSISGGLQLYDGINPNAEMPFGGYLDGISVTVRSDELDAGGFLRGGFISTMLNPGDGFNNYGFVTANVPRESDGIADARNTFTSGFTAGDTALLIPYLAAAPVPIPGAFWLMTSGLGVLVAGLQRTRLRL